MSLKMFYSFCYEFQTQKTRTHADEIAHHANTRIRWAKQLYVHVLLLFNIKHSLLVYDETATQHSHVLGGSF